MDKYNAQVSLENADYSPKRLLALHAGVMIGISLLLSIISHFLNHTIQPSGGLEALNSQALLTTAQTVLQWTQTLVTPFWAAGLTYAAIGIARGRETFPRDLTAGFHKFAPLLTSTLVVSLQYGWRMMLGTMLASQILLFTPAAETLYAASEKIESLTSEADLQALLGGELLPVMLTCGVILTLVLLVLVVPVFYRYRMTTYLIMDGQESSGLRATLRSRMMMLNRRWELAKLDLSFWWYYLLLALGMALCYGDMILGAAGISLPMSEQEAYWIFLGLGLLAQLLVKIYAGPKVAVTYAHCYDRFLNGQTYLETSAPEVE